MPRNILLFMTDQQRTDYVGYAADSCVSTPNIDWIAQHAHFTCCNTTNPICSPARTSLITGRYPRQIGTLTMAGSVPTDTDIYAGSAGCRLQDLRHRQVPL